MMNAIVTINKPVVGSHTAPFQRYLDQQPPERVSAIKRAERAWLQSRRPASTDDGRRSSATDALEREFETQMYGFEDRAAGGFDNE